jgi:hypothetical protein
MSAARVAAHCLTAFRGRLPNFTRLQTWIPKETSSGEALPASKKSESLNFRPAGQPNVTIV